jgi:crossover junction endodeoxyribonuclease RuvC
MIILGIDPGTVVMGYGLVEVKGKQLKLLAMGAIQLDKLPNHQLKLKKIYDKVSGLIKEYHPDFCAVEAPFYGKNAQSMLKLGRAQGVCMVAALNRDIQVLEYSPRKIKQSITGSGSASKEQVAAMLKTICKFEEQPRYLDATDGLAVAVCHYFQSQSPLAGDGGGAKSWKEFIRKNPKRIK